MGLNETAKMPILSLIVPLYNAKSHVDACINSIKVQSFQAFEVLLTDDGSTDDTGAFCREAQAEDTRFNYIRIEHRGTGNARNEGLRAAKGKYICFMDADDTFATDTAIEDMVKLMERTEEEGRPADILVGNYLRQQPDGTTEMMYHGFLEDEDSAEYIFRFNGFFAKGHLSYVWGKLYRKSFIDKNLISFSDLEYAEDKLFNFYCYANEPVYLFTENAYYIYKRHSGAGSFIYRKNLDEIWLDIALCFEKYIRNKGNHPEYLDLCAYTICFGIYFHAKQELDFGKGKADVFKVLKRYRENDRIMRYMLWLANGRYIRKINNRAYRSGIPVFARLLDSKRYGTLTLAIEQITKHGWDKRFYLATKRG